MLNFLSLSQVCFAIFPMDKNIEQRICLKFDIENGISCAESLKMLQKAYDESTLSKTRAYEWYSRFKSGRDVLEDFPRSGRPSTSLTEVNIAKVKQRLREQIRRKRKKGKSEKRKTGLKNFLVIGLFDGISVLFRQGPTLKAIKLIWMNYK